ncbi:phage tail protein [Sorangium sp. So ce726]|uniref:phage tail protein n=1 Tax=Sorangium sp. So ce726 TaxID=3133319 RepID=UPI003F62502F
MAERETDPLARPFMGFAFAIEISVPGTVPRVCNAAFAECDGLEMTMDVKTIRQGGDNGRQVRLTGPMGFGTLTLKRGMTANFDLWTWFDKLVETPGLRADAVVVLYAAGQTESPQAQRAVSASWELSRCVPVKLKAPPLNARDGMVAIEEFQLAYESLRLRPRGQGGG